jgi:hypothetical protein
MADMLKAIALFEIRNRLLSISTWVYAGIFFVAAFFWVAAAGGLFKDAFVSFGSSKIFINSPHALALTVGVLGMFGATIMATIMGRAVHSDFEHRTHHFFFTSPITKFQYLAGRFSGALLVVIGIFLSIGIGTFLATMMPGLDGDRIGPNRLAAYVWPYVLILIPNAILIGGVFFMIATLTRKMLPVYIGSVLLLIGHLISNSLLRDIDNKMLAAMIDPFGTSAIGRVIEYWTITERNERLLPLEGVFLWNRVMWFSIAIAAIVFCYVRFEFAHFSAEQLSRRARKEAAAEKATEAEALIAIHQRERLVISPDDPHGWAMLPRMVWLNFIYTVKNVYFGVLVFAGLLLMVFFGMSLGKVYGTETWPVTYQIIEAIVLGFGLFMLTIITFYAGELVWRERDQRMDQLIDTMPSPTWLPFVAKLVALMLIPLVLSIVLIFCGLGLQISKGYLHFELHLYLSRLLGPTLLYYWMSCALALTVHSVINNKYLGHFVMIAFYLFLTVADTLGLEHNLYKFSMSPTMPYSDMNGFGHFYLREWVFNGYWVAASILLLIAGFVFWTRGMAAGWRERWVMAKSRLSKSVVASALLFGALFVAVGSFIFYNTNILNNYDTAATRQQRQADYEKRYKVTEKDPQPRVTAVKVNVDLFPRKQSARMSGSYRLVNNNEVNVDNIHLIFMRSEDVVIDKLEFSIPADMINNDVPLGVKQFKLRRSLAPKEQIQLDFDISLPTRGFVNGEGRTVVVNNGSFINAMDMMPTIGYQDRIELTVDKDRKKHDLQPKERMLDRDDTEGLKRNYLTNFADWIDFAATVSTDEDQIAIAPGYLQREWKAEGRRYFEFKMDAPILHFSAFQSARYEIKRDVWRGPNGDVALEIYHHPTHTFNLDRMMASSKASLAYMSDAFGPYQHRQFRIVEFPRYRTFAQAFPNTIPYSEGVGFIARVRDDDEKDINYPYYITAHEVAHQWWGHQVIGGDVQGATVLSETLAQYSALMVMKAKYGDAKMKKFLAYELDQYLTGRALEQKKELPLSRVENQGYIHHQKGGLVMYALQDYIGEEKLNAALKRFRDDFACKGPPYPNSTMLIKRLREVTPAHLQYVIDDMFDNIIVFENRVTKATYKALKDGKYEVRLTVHAKKRKADELGKENDVAIADWIDIGILDDKGAPIFLEKRKIEKEESEFVISIDKRPAKAGIDPFNKLIDRRPKDNMLAVELSLQKEM